MCAPGPEFSVHDVYSGWCKGLRQCGVEVIEFNLHERLQVLTEVELPIGDERRKAFSLEAAVEMVFEGLQSVLYRTWPDVVIMVSGFFTDQQLFDDIRRARPQKLVMIHTESPYEEDRQVSLAPHFDVNVVNDPINLYRYPAGSMYVPHAHDPDLHHPNGRTSEYDFSFVGTAYPSRIEFFEKVRWPRGSRVTLAGNWESITPDSPVHHLVEHPDGECLDNPETARLYRMSDMSVNLYRGKHDAEFERPENAQGWAVGPREIELAACGTFFARDPRGEGDMLFPMLPTITDPDELSDVIEWSMTNPHERQAAADAARAAVADRTFESSARRLLAALDI